MEAWYCIYTKPKMEESVSRQLLTLPDIEVLNPKMRCSRISRGKFKECTEELFPCYLFSRFSPSKFSHMIAYTRGVRRILSDYSGRPQVIDCEIIDQIKSRLKDGFIYIEPIDLHAGDAVVIKEGPLKGFEGIFISELKARERVLILLNAITYQTKVEIRKEFLKKK